MTDLDRITVFAKVSDIWNDTISDRNGLFEFVKNVVMKEGGGRMLSDLSNMYVLVCTNDFPATTFTNKHSVDLSMVTTTIIIGYLWVCPIEINDVCDIYHFIKYVDSRIAGLNIAKYMIEKYERRHHAYLIPLEIVRGSERYWKRYFIANFYIHSIREFMKWIDENEFHRNGILWDALITIF